MKFESSLKMKLIYVFRINDEAHQGCLKIGEATCKEDNTLDLKPCCHALNQAAKERINQYTQTAGITYDLLYTEATLYLQQGKLCSFNDKEVHKVLLRSGIKRKVFDQTNNANEWFCSDLETVKRAITAVKQGRTSLLSNEIQEARTPIVFRPEQAEAIRKTEKQFKKGNQMLWNAKMRFGKTLSALQVTKDMNYQRTLILTHRPVVDEGWFDDFGKIFYDRTDYEYGSKHKGNTFSSLEMHTQKSFTINQKAEKGKYVYFASMQDLRGSELVGGKFDKNNQIFSTQWDLLIVDEAHEGTKTELGQAVLNELIKPSTKVLRLSGTPFNLLDDFKDEEIYTWDYVMEQRAKAEWDILHQGDPNPYESLPKLNIYTYDLGRLLHDYADEEITINNFTSLIDPQSWEEFMPKGVSKQLFNSFKKYYDEDIFSAAGKRIRAMARVADHQIIEERIERITSIFNTFRNPDKETVLTPWRVVNMHLGDCLGGYNFWSENWEEALDQPRYINQGEVTQRVFRPNARILEINSKSGLYPLYMAYNIYRVRKADEERLFGDSLTREQEQALWDQVLRENIFVICKTPMAKSITKRTLCGFRDNTKVNTRYFEDLINQITNKTQQFVEKVSNGKGYWKVNEQTYMKFDAIVGNPPYQVMDGGAGASALPIYHKFVEIGKKLNPNYLSLIIPARWYAGGRNLDEFRNTMLNDKHLRLLVDFPNGKDCFPSAFIAGGICYFLWNKKEDGLCQVTNVINNKRFTKERYLNEFNIFIRSNISVSIISKIGKLEDNLSSLLSAQRPYGLRTYERGKEEPFENAIKLYTSKGLQYIEEERVTALKDNIYKFKVMLNRADSGHPQEEVASGKQANVICKGQVMKPGEVCTETWLSIGSFDNESEATNLNSYLSTKFVRFMMLQGLSSIMVTDTMFKFVPLQDFTSHSDINWSEPISSIDQQLYCKYALTADEIAFIEKTIKPM